MKSQQFSSQLTVEIAKENLGKALTIDIGIYEEKEVIRAIEESIIKY